MTDHVVMGYDSAEWYEVNQIPMVEQLAQEYLNLNDELLTNNFTEITNEDTMLLETTMPESINQVRILSVENVHRGPPDRNSIDSAFNFSVEINSSDVNKKKYMYSHRLNRIYVDKDSDFSVHFNWDLQGEMNVRSCVVFADDAQAQKRPECCLQHLPQGADAGIDKHIGLNVLHSSRPLGTLGVDYQGNAEAADSWLSTVVTLAKSGPDPVAHAYRFICKSSCSSGINRRAIAIIFTLENAQGAVYGRQMVGARVCACPRRDMLKDEEAEGVFKAGKKRVPANMTSSQRELKKIKVEPVAEEVLTTRPDDRVLTLPPLEIIGSRAVVTGLEVMLSMMISVRDLRREDPQTFAKYEVCIAKLRHEINILKNPPTSN